MELPDGLLQLFVDIFGPNVARKVLSAMRTIVDKAAKEITIVQPSWSDYVLIIPPHRRFPNLRKLTLSCFSDHLHPGITQLVSLVSLTVVFATELCWVRKKVDLPSLTALTGLTHLDLTLCNTLRSKFNEWDLYMPLMILDIPTMPMLQSLKLREFQPGVQSMMQPNLQELALTCSKFRFSDFQIGCTTLRTVYLMKVSLLQGFTGLTGLTSLTDMWLDSVEMDSLNGLSVLCSLQSLIVHNCFNISDVTMTINVNGLKTLTSLKHLQITGDRLGRLPRHILPGIAALIGVEFLNLDHDTGLYIDDLDPLLEMTKMTALKIRLYPFDVKEGCIMFLQLKNLKRLMINSKDMSVDYPSRLEPCQSSRPESWARDMLGGGVKDMI